MSEFFKDLLEQAAEEGKVIRFTLRAGEWEVSLGEDIDDMTLPELEDYLEKAKRGDV